MSEPQERAEEDLSDTTSEPKKASPSKGPWDPFRYLIKTISPQQRAELLQLQVPILPPEEFMTTRELRVVRMKRLRRWRPAIIGAVVLILALVAAAVHFWGSPTIDRPSPPTAPLTPEPAATSNSLGTASPAVRVSVPPSADTVRAAVTPVEPPSIAPRPASLPSAAPSSSSPKPRTSGGEHAAAAKVKPAAASAPSGQAPRKPDGPDFEQPFNPQ